MAERSRALAKPDATERVAQVCADVAGLSTRARSAKESAMKHIVKHIHFVGIGGVGHERHRGGAAQPRLSGQRLGPVEQRASPIASTALGARVAIGHDAENIEGANAVVVSTAVRSRQPGSAGRAPSPHSDRAARRDARGTDAPEAGHRDCRHARQDHDHRRWWRACWPRAGSIRPS